MAHQVLDNFAWQLRYYRLSRGWFQRELSAKAGLGRTTIKDLERGQPPSLLTAVILSEALEVPLPYLLTPATATQRRKLDGLENTLRDRHWASLWAGRRERERD